MHQFKDNLIFNLPACYMSKDHHSLDKELQIKFLNIKLYLKICHSRRGIKYFNPLKSLSLKFFLHPSVILRKVLINLCEYRPGLTYTYAVFKHMLLYTSSITPESADTFRCILVAQNLLSIILFPYYCFISQFWRIWVIAEHIIYLNVMHSKIIVGNLHRKPPGPSQQPLTFTLQLGGSLGVHC